MLIYLNTNGTIEAIQPTTLTQGSNDGELIVIGEGLSNFSTIDVKFKLPVSNQLINGGFMIPLDNFVVNDSIINAYKLEITENITNFAGNLQITFKVTDANNVSTNSYIVTIPIIETLEPNLPSVPDTDWYDEIKEAFSYISGKIDIVPTNIAHAVDVHNVSRLSHANIRTLISNIVDGTTIVSKTYNDENGVNIKNNYQKKTDNSLNTTSKQIVGAINELENENNSQQGEIDIINNKVNNATTTNAGIVTYATDVEASAGLLENKSITPKQLQTNINNAMTSAVIYKGRWVITGQTNYSFFEDFLPIKSGWEWYCQGTTTTIDGVEYVQGDYARFNQDVAIGETIITSMIDKIDNSDSVISVDGQTGAVITDAVKFTEQTLTEQQKTQARSNIGAGASGFSGDYNDLNHKPIINADLSGLTTGSANADYIYRHSGDTTTNFIKGNLYKVENNSWVLVSVSKLYIDTNLDNIRNKYIGGNTNYGSTLVTNVDNITKDGFYTIQSTGTGIPNNSYNWFVIHQNSSAGTIFATQRAVAFANSVIVYERTKTNSIWNSWELANAPTEAIVPQIRFNGTLSGNIITGILDSSVSNYTFINQGLVNIYLVLPLTTLTGVLNSNYVIKLYDKNNNLIVINSINHISAITSSNVGDMCQLQNYNVNTGYEWQFTARYSQFDNGGTIARVLYTTDIVRESVISLTGGELYTHIVNNTLRPNTYVLVSDTYTNSGTTYTEGVKYKITGTWIDGELFTEAIQESDPTREDVSHKTNNVNYEEPSPTEYVGELGLVNYAPKNDIDFANQQRELSKNLFNKDLQRTLSTYYIELPDNTVSIGVYSSTANTSGIYFWCSQLDSQKTSLHGANYWLSRQTITLQPNCKYLSFETITDIDNFMVVIGTANDLGDFVEYNGAIVHEKEVLPILSGWTKKITILSTTVVTTATNISLTSYTGDTDTTHQYEILLNIYINANANYSRAYIYSDIIDTQPTLATIGGSTGEHFQSITMPASTLLKYNCNDKITSITITAIGYRRIK